MAAIAALLAVMIPDRRPTVVRPTELWGEPARHWVGPGEAPSPAPGAPAAPAYFVVEQDSPIVSSDSKLVEALGFESPAGTFRAVLPEGTPTPVGRVVTFRTGADNQTEIRLHLMRGRSESVTANHSLGWVRFAGLPAGPRGQARVAVAFQVVDVAILLAAQDPENGRPIPIAASEQPPGFGKP